MNADPREQLEARNKILHDLARLPGMDDARLDHFLDEICRTSSRLLDVDRVGIWLFNPERSLIVCLGLFDRRDGAIGRGHTLEAERYPAYFAALIADVPVAADDALSHPATAGRLVTEYLAPIGAGALLDTPIRVERELAGVLCHEHLGASRAWDAAEIESASALADLAGMVLEMRARWEAERSGRSLAALIESSPDAIYAVSPAHEIVSWSRGAAALYGHSEAEAIGSDPATLLQSAPALVERAARECLVAQGAWQGEGMRQARDGRALTVVSRRTQLRDAHGKPESILVVETDVTERRRLEAQLLRAQRLESVGLLASGVAHGINNVFTPILTAVALLRGDPAGTDREEMLRSLEAGVMRGAGMLRQLMAYARGGEGHRSPVPLGPLIREAAKLFGETFPKTIEIRVDLPTRPPTASANAVQVQQLLTHLALNSRDAMPSGGRLTLRVREERVGAGRFAALEVEDSGVGIPEAELGRVFEPFYTTKPTGFGSGLGLSAAAGIVRAHGGTLSLTSEPGRRTTATALLPLAEGSPEEAPPAGPPDAPRGHGELILFADDSPQIRDLSAELLRRHGYQVVTASDGAEAVGLFSIRRAEVRCVILNAQMPVMDGRAATRAIRTIDHSARIILASGLSGGRSAALDPPAPVAAVLPKPYPSGLLLATVHAVIAGLPAPKIEADS